MRSVALLVAFALGLPAGRAFPGAFRLLFRAQLAALTSTLALFVGWSASFGATALTGLGVLLGGEVAALGLGTLLLHRGMTTAPAVASSVSNSGFWSIPVAGALFGPAGAAFAVLYDVVSVPRAVLVTRTLRAYAPCRPSGRSAVVDYLPQAALVTGLGLRALSNPPAVVDLLPAAGVAVGVVGFFLLGMAMPQCLPVRADWRDALPAVALRFGVTTSLCLAFQGRRRRRARRGVGPGPGAVPVLRGLHGQPLRVRQDPDGRHPAAYRAPRRGARPCRRLARTMIRAVIGSARVSPPRRSDGRSLFFP